MPATDNINGRLFNTSLAAAMMLFGPTISCLQSQNAAHITADKVYSPAFEVASIKPNNKQDGRWRLTATPDGYSAAGVSLLQLIEESYGISVKERISGGPAWLDADKFDLEAKLNPVDIPDERRKLAEVEQVAMRALLAERFDLKVHLGSKIFPVFNLIIAKGGPKLGEVTTGSLVHEGCLVSRKGYEGCTLAEYAESLRYKSGRIVLDKTGLTGRFDFQAHWTSDATTDEAKSSGTSIFTALQEQLGLKLVPSTAPLDILVVDSAEHPSAN